MKEISFSSMFDRVICPQHNNGGYYNLTFYLFIYFCFKVFPYKSPRPVSNDVDRDKLEQLGGRRRWVSNLLPENIQISPTIDQNFSTVLSTSLGKTLFAWPFILNENILFWLTISNQKPFLFCFSVLLSNIYSKIKFMAKNWSDLCNFYSKVIFGVFDFLLFFAEFKFLIFHNNIAKISEKLNKRNLLKICLQVTYPTDFCKICIHFYYRKKWKYLIF